MSILMPGDLPPEYGLCRYGTSRLACRGPERPLDAPYVAFLGGSETFGRFVPVPFVEQLERLTGRICVNLGTVHTGLDAWLHDAELIDIATRGEIAVIQLPGAAGLNTPYFRVHPRRNDRFLEALPVLKHIYPELDFTDFTFVNHMLAAQFNTSPDRFAAVRDALKQAWVDRMQLLLARFSTPPVLLWLRHEGAAVLRSCGELGMNPSFVDAQMVDSLRPAAAAVVALDLPTAGAAKEVRKMRFGPMQAPAAAQMPGPTAHKAVTRALLDLLAVPD